MLLLSRPPQGGNLTSSIIQKTQRILAAVAPAEAGSIGSTVSVVWNEETVVFVRDRLQELGLDRPHRAPRRPVDLVVQRPIHVESGIVLMQYQFSSDLR